MQARQNLDNELWNEMCPSHPGAELPEDDFFESFRDVKIAPLLPAAIAYLPALSGYPGASNNWAVAAGQGGLPLLANDPHLGMTVPQIWYFCHLCCPTLNVCGASLAGSPAVVIGRNENVA